MVSIERRWNNGVWRYYGTFDSIDEAKAHVESKGFSWSEFRVAS